jgi:hypothetical protein
MSNPFDNTGSGDNPFAEDHNDIPLSPQRPSMFGDTSVNEGSTAELPRPTSNTARHVGKLHAIASTVMGSNTFKDPVTGIPISERDILHREDALKRREQEIESMENQVRSGTYVPPTTRNNWPPILKWWAYYPDEDLPENYRKLANLLFMFFSAQAIPYAINVIAAFALLGAHGDANVSVGMMIALSLFFLLVWIPLGYDGVYFNFYNALMKQKALKLLCSLAGCAIWWSVLVLNVIGVTKGGVGLLPMIDLYGSGHGVIGTISLFVVLTGSVDAAALAWVFLRLVRFYRSEGLSSKAFLEAGQIAVERAQDNPRMMAQFTAIDVHPT